MNKRKKPLSAYLIYYQERMQQLKETKDINVNAFQKTKIIANEWRNLSPIEKEPYTIKAKSLMEKYLKENNHSPSKSSKNNSKRKSNEMKPMKSSFQSNQNKNNNQFMKENHDEDLNRISKHQFSHEINNEYETKRETLFTLDFIQMKTEKERELLMKHKEILIKEIELPIIKEDLQIVMGMGNYETKIMRLKEFYFELKLERKNNESLIETIQSLFTQLPSLSQNTPNSLTTTIEIIRNCIGLIEEKMKLTMNEMIKIKMNEKNEKIRKIESKYEEEIQELLNL